MKGIIRILDCCLLSISIIVIVLLIGCSSSDKYDEVEPIEYKYKNKHNASSIRVCDEDVLNVDLLKFATVSENTFDKDLAKLGLLLSTDLYSWADFMVKDNGEYKAKKLISVLPFKDVELIQPKQSEYDVDKNDLSTVQLSHYEFTYKKKNYQVFFAIYKGTDRTFEWDSNVDIGLDSSEYANNMDALHPDWKNKLNHKGFDVASNRSIEKINEYMEQHKLKKYTPIMFISGHSRGGSVSNITAAYYTNQNIKTFAYTFASSLTTQDENVSSYQNIFNVVNEDDLISQIPPSYLGFKRYGVDISESIASISSTWNEYANASYQKASSNALFSALQSCMPTRDSMYNITSAPIDQKAKDFGYETYEAAQAAKQKKLQALSKISNYELFVKMSDSYFDATEGSFGYTWKVTPGLFLNVIPLYMQGESMLTIQGVAAFAPSLSSSLLPAFAGLMGSKNSIEYPHFPESYMVILNNYKSGE